MERSSSKGRSFSLAWVVLGVILLVAIGLLLVAALMNPGSAAPAPTSTPTEDPTPTATATPPDTPTAVPSPTSEPVVASVNGHAITRSYLTRTVKLNRVLGELSGAATLGERETLQQLIAWQLVLQEAAEVDEPSDAEVEALIRRLERSWDVTDETVVKELEEEGLDRAFLEDMVKRLLAVQAGMERLEREGYEVSKWLQEAEQDANIMIVEDLVSTEKPEGEPTGSPTEESRSSTPTSQLHPDVPEVAPDFTLNQAGGGSFTLEDQLEEGPVVLVFFERCG